MIIKKISSNWFMLTSEGDEGKMVWFGYSEAEVMFKFNAFIRRIDLTALQ
tara:strand:- start:3255 stop:3404 length:150 start_codon:yes stop_codon:yes gene_type:complete